MEIKPVKLAVKCERCKELTSCPIMIDGDISVCRECYDDLIYEEYPEDELNGIEWV